MYPFWTDLASVRSHKHASVSGDLFENGINRQPIWMMSEVFQNDTELHISSSGNGNSVQFTCFFLFFLPLYLYIVKIEIFHPILTPSVTRQLPMGAGHWPRGGFTDWNAKIRSVRLLTAAGEVVMCERKESQTIIMDDVRVLKSVENIGRSLT